VIFHKEFTNEENKKINKYVDLLKGMPKIINCEVVFEYLRILEQNHGKLVKPYLNKINIKILRPAISFIWANKNLDIMTRTQAFELSKKSLFFSSREDFESFMLFTEIDRPFADKFWQPRKNSKMSEVCQGLQQLADDEIDVLFVAEPPRVGKTTLGLWFDAWYAARAIVEKWERTSILAVGHSAGLVATFFKEIDQFCNADKYKFFQVFPELKEKYETSAKNQTINFGEARRYQSLSFRSADGSLAGSVEADLLLHIDDLVSGMEEALNPERLDKKWQTLYGDIRQRRKEGAKILYIGTIWSLFDPQVRFRKLLAEDPNFRIKIIEIPALDENDQSNFNFQGGFSTEHYISERSGMDNVTWNCIYQQIPMEREGLLFIEDKFKTFTKEQLQVKPKRKYTFCDVAWGGSDFVSLPILYEYDDGLFLSDVVFSKGDKTITQAKVKVKIINHSLTYVLFEANNGGDEYADDVKRKLKEENYFCKIESKKSPNTSNAKLERILKYSTEIQNIKILDKKDRTPEYQAFINNLLSFNQNGKNRNDDAPDSLALHFHWQTQKIEPVKVLPKQFKLF